MTQRSRSFINVAIGTRNYVICREVSMFYYFFLFNLNVQKPPCNPIFLMAIWLANIFNCLPGEFQSGSKQTWFLKKDRLNHYEFMFLWVGSCAPHLIFILMCYILGWVSVLTLLFWWFTNACVCFHALFI